MKAEIIKISKCPSKFTGNFYWIFFKDCETGKSYRMPTASMYRNFRLWKSLVLNPEQAAGVICEGLVVKGEGIIDADYMTKCRISQKLKKEV